VSAVAEAKIRPYQIRQAWETVRSGEPKRLVSKHGSYYTIELDGVIKDRAGVVVGALQTDGTLIQSDMRPFPKGLVLLGPDDSIIGTVVHNQLTVLRKSSMDQAFSVLTALKTPGGVNKAVFAEDRKTRLGSLTPEGKILSLTGETLALLQLDGTFQTPGSKPYTHGGLIMKTYKNNAPIARINKDGTVELAVGNGENLFPPSLDEEGKAEERVKKRGVRFNSAIKESRNSLRDDLRDAQPPDLKDGWAIGTILNTGQIMSTTNNIVGQIVQVSTSGYLWAQTPAFLNPETVISIFSNVGKFIFTKFSRKPILFSMLFVRNCNG
jgi:hypothetical protein